MNKHSIVIPLLLLGPSGCTIETVEEANLETTEQLVQPDPSFEGTYTDCDEFAGLGIVPLANVESYVPDDYIIIEPQPGAALLVAQAGSCASIEVEGKDAAPGIFAQLGVLIVPPDGTGNSNFYQLMFASNHLRLAQGMKKAGANARFSPLLSYELTGTALDVGVPHPPPLAWQIEGPIVPPNPNDPANPTTVFNYWHQSKKFGNVLQRNTVDGIRFGDGSAVVLTALGGELEDIVGGTTLPFPVFAAPEIFDVAELDVETNAF